MKQILIESCGRCPLAYKQDDDIWCERITITGHTKILNPDIIEPNCPLPDKEETE